MKLKKKGKLDEINWDEIEAEAKDSSDQGNGWGKGVTIITKCTLLIYHQSHFTYYLIKNSLIGSLMFSLHAI